MAVKIRLTRMGSNKRPFYRVVVADSRYPRDGRFIEQIGHYNPLIEENQLTLNLERVDHWISQGAKPSETVKKLIKKAESEK